MKHNYETLDAARAMVQTVAEPCQADSEQRIMSTPEATGNEIRNIMDRHNISVAAAATVLHRSPRYIRAKRNKGTHPGRETWEFLCFLPQRHKTLMSLNNSDCWVKNAEKQEVKLLMVKHWGSRIPCVAMRFNPPNFNGTLVLNSCTKHEDSSDIYFGTIENTGKMDNGFPVLPVVSNRPEDHIRSCGSFTLQLAHEHCIEHWHTLQCGDTIDVSSAASAYAFRSQCRSSILQSDRQACASALAV